MNILSETRDEDSNFRDQEQGAGEDAGQQGDFAQQQRAQRPRPGRGLRRGQHD